MTIQLSNATIANSLDIWPETVPTKQKGKIAYYVVVTSTIPSIALKRCVLNATKLVIKPRNAERKILSSATNVALLATMRLDA